MPESWTRDRRPVRRVAPDEPPGRDRWPATIPAVGQLLDEGLDLPEGVTLLVGENGTGKSTIVEAVAMAFGLHELSHGESFLEVLRTRFASPGLYCLDEPEAALSFSAQIALVGTLHELAQNGAQVLCATHSPLLAALPGATLLEVGPWGIRRSTYDDLELVAHWKSYLAEPMRYLRHVL
jgi:predicted ATPase